MSKNPWDTFFDLQKDKDYYKKLSAFLKEDRKRRDVCPASNMVLNAFKLCPYYDLKVVMIGDEPLCDGMDMGLAFSSMGMNPPISQINIKKEIVDDIYKGYNGKRFPWGTTNNLSQWAVQGVLMINSILTVAQGVPGSHRGVGWETFTIELIRWLSDTHPNKIAFILWGEHVYRYQNHINKERHKLISAPRVNGSRCFSQANEFIFEAYEKQRAPIAWHLLN